MELFVWVLLVFAWVAWQIIQRALKPPKPLGGPRGEAPPGQPAPSPEAGGPLSDIEWGRPAPEPPPVRTAPPRPEPVRIERATAAQRFEWERHAAQAELQAARDMARRQEAQRLQVALQQRRRPHPHRPILHTRDGLRDAVVAATVLGPCRALSPYEPPG